MDWYRIHGYVNGEEVINYKRASDSINKAVELPGDSGILEVVLEDYSGNLSEPEKFVYRKDYAESGPIDESNVPDAVLRQAILDQVGSTTADAEAFTGTLDLTGMDIRDLTGLSFVSHAENIILSGTPIETINTNIFGAYVQKVDLSDCANLKMITREAFENTQELREVDITGCSALQVLEIVDSSVEKLTYGDAAAFPNMVRLDLSGSRFDMSENTSEYAFAAQIATQTDDDKDVVVSDPDKVNLAFEAAIVEDQITSSLQNALRLVDGNKTRSFTFRVPGIITIDLGREQTIDSWLLENDYSIKDGSSVLVDFEIRGSNDGETYTPIVVVEGNDNPSATGDIENPQPYRYYQLAGIKASPNGSEVRELELYGHYSITYESEVVYDNQRPRLQAEMDTNVTLEKGKDQVLDLNEILDNAIAEGNAQSLTVNGNTAADLEGASWLDPDYALEPEVPGTIHLIQVTDSEGNASYVDTIDASVDGSYTVNYITLDSANLEGETLYTFTINVKGITSVLERVIAEAEQMVADGALRCV